MHPDIEYPSYEEALWEYDRMLGWEPEEDRDGTTYEAQAPSRWLV